VEPQTTTKPPTLVSCVEMKWILCLNPDEAIDDLILVLYRYKY
jgi:hypothetical protein